MDSASIRRRLESVWSDLPDVFTMRDVLRIMRMSKDAGRLVRLVLDNMVSEGRLSRTFVLHGLGRRPAAWSKSPGRGVEDVLAEAVRLATMAMPVEFTVNDLLRALRLSLKYKAKVLDVLSKLSTTGVVVRLTDCRPNVGRPAIRWSADPGRVAEELAARERISRARAAEEAWEASRLDRLLSPWRPFDGDSSSRKE